MQALFEDTLLALDNSRMVRQADPTNVGQRHGPYVFDILGGSGYVSECKSCKLGTAKLGAIELNNHKNIFEIKIRIQSSDLEFEVQTSNFRF